MKVNNTTQYALLAGLGFIGLGLAGNSLRMLLKIPTQQLSTLRGLAQHKVALLQALGGVSLGAAATAAAAVKACVGKKPSEAKPQEEVKPEVKPDLSLLPNEVLPLHLRR